VRDCVLHKFVHCTDVIGKQYWQRNLRSLGGKTAINEVKYLQSDKSRRFCTDALDKKMLKKMKNGAIRAK